MATTEEQTLRKFQYERLLNQDTRSKTINLLGSIDSQPAIIIAEKHAFPTSTDVLSSFSTSFLSGTSLIEHNDIYHWFHATTSTSLTEPDLKLTLIHPATAQHIQKYSFQQYRMVTETPSLYAQHVHPYIQLKRSGGRLNWVYNVLDKKKESESIIAEVEDPEEGWMLLPDLKWDRKTLSSLYTLAMVRRRDVASLRDLKKRHVPWLKRMREGILDGLCEKYPGVDRDCVKLYVHYQPSYYHFHIHAVAISHDGGFGQAAGKALLLGNVISQLESMADEEAGFADVKLEYFIGEESELWQSVFAPLKAASS